MPTYVVLMNWTDQGVRTARDTVRRRDQADALAQKHGTRIEQVYWVCPVSTDCLPLSHSASSHCSFLVL